MRGPLRQGWICGVTITAMVALTAGCSSIMSSATTGLADSLRSAVLDQNDLETVRQGAPAYLLLIDGLIADNPKNVDLLLAGASLYSSYADAFVDNPERAARLSRKARDYGWEALCRGYRDACGIWSAPYDEFERVVNGMGRKQVPVLYGTGAAWASWIKANSDDWSAIADKARVDAMMQRVVALDETYEGGAAFLYLGILATLLPEASGGNPELGKTYFERVIELSNGRNLMAKVLLATGLVVVYGYVVEAFIGWYSGSGYEISMLKNRFVGPYAPFVYSLVFCNAISIQLLWFKKVRSNLASLFVLSLIINTGMFLERFMIIVVSLSHDYMPSAWGLFIPGRWDWGILIGSLGFFLVMMFIFVRTLPMISIFEVRELLHNTKHKEHAAEAGAEAGVEA